MMYTCSQSSRRELVLATPGLNGIDYLEVTGPPGCGTELAITFLQDATALALTTANIMITGGAPVTPVSVTPATASDPNVVTVSLDQTGDFGSYTLTLVAAGATPPFFLPPASLDPVLSTVSFSFKAGCPSPAECSCGDGCSCDHCQPQPVLPAPPDINYLARDYDGFRQVILDRMAVTAPDWTEQHAADLGIVLAEALAYAADHLSYTQDAVSTEAYLGTARSRISLRRHARLVDYRIGEGCNARTLITVLTTATAAVGGLDIPAGTLFYPTTPGLSPALTAPTPAALAGASPVFSALQSATVYKEQNRISFYTWGDDDCCLPAGATQATLYHPRSSDPLTRVQSGTILILQEVLGPTTGAPGDADPAHRCAVMLTAVQPTTDPVTGTAVTMIAWAAADALMFPLQISTTIGTTVFPDVSVAYGNVVLASHGTQTQGEQLPVVPAAGRYYPQLAGAPLTFSVPFSAPGSVAGFLQQDVTQALPAITLTDENGQTWLPLPDLLNSGSEDRNFVPEVEQDGTAFLRFGDGQYGALPAAGMTFTASYWTGNGSAGNVGPDSLGHAVVAPPFPVASVTGVRNPLPVTGGTDMEAMDHIRQCAPFAFQMQLRCVTEDDYGQQAQLLPGVSAARGTLRWTGSWYTAFVSVEPDAPALTSQLVQSVDQDMSLLRMLGTDVAVEAAIIVGLQITLAVCVDPDHFRGDVYTALMTTFTGPDGVLAAADFTFGETVYASPLVAAAQAVEGVSSVTLATFSRLDQPWVDGTTAGFLTMGQLEIARCDNDPDHLDYGQFTLVMDGGK